jgi:molybdenum cofactor guanylyltransferase
VLAGGSSRRFGRDKALAEVGGRPLAVGVAAALRDAGATEVLAVGGDEAALRALGLTWVADRWPGEGPLGGVVTGLAAAREALAVVAACDLAVLESSVVAWIVAAALRRRADALVPVVEGRRQPLLAAYRTEAGSVLEERFRQGGRSMHEALTVLEVVEVALPPALAAATVDVDTPADLRAIRGRSRSDKGIS